MKCDVKSYRKKKGIPLNLPIKYRHVWADRIEHIKILVLHMGLKDIADHYKTNVANLSAIMGNYEVSANVERHKNKLRGK
jgi:hypothetical protein